MTNIPEKTPTTSAPITPFPRRNHLSRLRRTRSRRRARATLGSALALGFVLSGTGFAASWATPSVDESVTPTIESSAAVAEAATMLTAEESAHTTAASTLDAATSALDKADDSVDTATLASYVKDLSDIGAGEPAATLSLAKKTIAETESVQVDISEDEKAEAAAAKQKAAEEAEARAAANTPAGAKAAASRMASEKYGWGAGEFSCLSSLWAKESGWSYTASNPSSGAYGIPQALPGSKMATVGSDWATNATTQISWGLDYIKRAYGTPCAAWGHSQAMNWY